MTAPFPDPEKIEQAIGDFGTNTADILESIAARHGNHYALKVGAVVGVICVIRTANVMVCEKFPPEIVELAQHTQTKIIGELVDSMFPSPAGLKDFEALAAAIKERRSQIKEFEKNVDSLLKQRMAAEQQLGVIIVGGPPKAPK